MELWTFIKLFLISSLVWAIIVIYNHFKNGWYYSSIWNGMVLIFVLESIIAVVMYNRKDSKEHEWKKPKDNRRNAGEFPTYNSTSENIRDDSWDPDFRRRHASTFNEVINPGVLENANRDGWDNTKGARHYTLGSKY